MSAPRITELTTASSGDAKNIPQLGNIPQVEVYSMDGCKFCRIAKAKLDELGVPYVTVDIEDDDDDHTREERMVRDNTVQCLTVYRRGLESIS